MENIAKGEQYLPKLTDEELEKTIEMLHISVQRRQTIINKEGTTKARASMVAKRKPEQVHLTEANEKYNNSRTTTIKIGKYIYMMKLKNVDKN